MPLVCPRPHQLGAPIIRPTLFRGNATDLSFLTRTTAEDINRVQNVGREAQQSRKHFILHDDQVRVFCSTPPVLFSTI